jgi:hypothetical protein
MMPDSAVSLLPLRCVLRMLPATTSIQYPTLANGRTVIDKANIEEKAINLQTPGVRVSTATTRRAKCAGIAASKLLHALAFTD